MATKAARDALEAQAKDHGNDAEKFREDLLNIARYIKDNNTQLYAE